MTRIPRVLIETSTEPVLANGVKVGGRADARRTALTVARGTGRTWLRLMATIVNRQNLAC